MLWSVGADIDTGVGKNTDFLIVGDEPGWKKLEIADERGIPIIDDQKLRMLFPNYKPKYI